MLTKALPDSKAGRPHRNRGAGGRGVSSAKRSIPGIGHPIHKPVDPRAMRLFELATETGFSGNYVKLLKLIQVRSEKLFGKILPINSTGAKGAICCEMGLSPTITRGLGVISRAVGLVGHILEESRNPMALEIWHRLEEEATEETARQVEEERAGGAISRRAQPRCVRGPRPARDRPWKQYRESRSS